MSDTLPRLESPCPVCQKLRFRVATNVGGEAYVCFNDSCTNVSVELIQPRAAVEPTRETRTVADGIAEREFHRVIYDAISALQTRAYEQGRRDTQEPADFAHHFMTASNAARTHLFDLFSALRAQLAEASRDRGVREWQRINAARSARWMAGSPGWTTLEIAGELAGEVGELANVCKKLRRSEMGVPGNKVSDDELRLQARGEIADVMIVLMLTASKLGIDLEDAVCETFNAKSVQMAFPERLSPGDAAE